ncbi:hypothetical protein Bca52824_060765 [Brassica carinata]|uniref:Uncharacterized protein n=1 Tax=Brassica carinata TaxID=52824 RepID=A0A8X7QX64_BRACI|nr:hypothetical protein Bca52824_060765 [Brassica carinata]
MVSFLTNGHQNLNRSSVAGSTRVCNPGKASWSRVKMMPIGSTIFKDLSRLKRFNSEEAIEYGLIIVRPPRIKDDAPLQDET